MAGHEGSTQRPGKKKRRKRKKLGRERGARSSSLGGAGGGRGRKRLSGRQEAVDGELSQTAEN